MTDFANLVIKADSSQVKTATKDLSGMSAGAGKLGGAMKALLPVLSAALAVNALGKMAVEAREFGAAMGEVSTLLDDVSQLPRINTEAKALAATFGGSPTAQVKAFYQAISAGAGNASEATAILTTANKLAVGGVTDIGTAVDGLTTIVNSFGLEASDAAGVSDAMFVAMRAGKTTIGELSSGIGSVAALAATAGVGFEELLGATAALTKGGISTSQSFNGLKAALSNIATPSKKATDAAAEMGIEFNLASLQSKGLAGFLGEMTEAADGNEQQLIDLFGSVEAVNTILALTGGSAESFADIMADMNTKTGQTDMAFGKIAQTMDFKLSIISGKIASTRVKVGEFLLTLADPIVDHVGENFDTYVNFLSGISKATTATVSAMVLAIKPFTDGFGAALTTVAEWTASFVTAVSGYFNDLGVSGLKVSELIGIGFSETFINVKSGIQIATIEAAAFVDTAITKVKGWVTSAEDTEVRLAAIDVARKGSLKSVIDENKNSTTAYADQLIQVKLNQGGFSLLETATVNLSTDTGTLDEKLAALSGTIVTTTTNTGKLNTKALEVTATLKSEKEALGLSSTELSIRNNLQTAGVTSSSALGLEIIDLVTEIDKEKQALTDAATKAGDLEKANEQAAVAAEAAWGRTNDYLATTFVDIFENGKGAFSQIADSFTTMIKRMVAEWAASKLMNLIGFGGTSSSGSGNPLSAIFGGGGGGVAGAVSTGASILTGASGIGAAATGGATLLPAGMGGGLAGVGSAIAGGVSAVGSGLASAGSAVMGAISAIPVWGWALGGAAVLANALDSGGTMSSNAGMLTQQLGHEGEFGIDAFDSGAQFTGFTRRANGEEATASIDAFRGVDSYLTNVFGETIGGSPNLNAGDFIGYNEKGTGRGAFFGTASEEGGDDGTPMDTQLGNYASRWVTLAGLKNGVDQATIDAIVGDGGVEGILARAGGLVTPDGSHARGIERVPYNGYIAELHEGERVQTKQEVLANNSGTTDNMVGQALMSILTYLIKTFDIVDRWNNNGLPQERTAP